MDLGHPRLGRAGSAGPQLFSRSSRRAGGSQGRQATQAQRGLVHGLSQPKRAALWEDAGEKPEPYDFQLKHNPNRDFGAVVAYAEQLGVNSAGRGPPPSPGRVVAPTGSQTPRAPQAGAGHAPDARPDPRQRTAPCPSLNKCPVQRTGKCRQPLQRARRGSPWEASSPGHCVPGSRRRGVGRRTPPRHALPLGGAEGRTHGPAGRTHGPTGWAHGPSGRTHGPLPDRHTDPLLAGSGFL